MTRDHDRSRAPLTARDPAICAVPLPRTYGALLLYPWVSFGLGVVWWVASEGEECEGVEGFGAVEPECDPGQRADLGVGIGSVACRPR